MARKPRRRSTTLAGLQAQPLTTLITGIGRPAAGRSVSSRSGSYVLPLLILMVVAFDLPILWMLSRSIFAPDPTLEPWVELVTRSFHRKILANTFEIAGITVLACAALGYPLAYWISRLSLRPVLRTIVVGMVVLPFWVSILVRTYAWIVVLGRHGLVNRALMEVGLVDTPIAFLYNRAGIIVGTTNVLLPFLVLPLLATMMRIDERLLHAAATLGASSRAIFWRVFFPLTLPAFAAGLVLVFILSLGFYVTPAVLGGNKVPMIASLIDEYMNVVPKWELGAALTAVLLITTLALFTLYKLLLARLP